MSSSGMSRYCCAPSPATRAARKSRRRSLGELDDAETEDSGVVLGSAEGSPTVELREPQPTKSTAITAASPMETSLFKAGALRAPVRRESRRIVYRVRCHVPPPSVLFQTPLRPVA